MDYTKKAAVLFVLTGMCGLCFSEKRLKVYTVVKGDTLHGIAQNFYGDASQWKKIYKYNDFIKNPNWIFPGDELVIPVEVAAEENVTVPAQEEKTAPATAEEPAQVAASTEAGMPEQPRVILPPPSVPPPDTEDENCFVAEKNWKGDGVIASEKDEKMIISQGDIVSIRMNDGAGLKVPVAINIYHIDRTIYNPDTGDKLGDLIRKVGVAEVSSDSARKVYTGRVMTASNMISVGDIVKVIKK